MHAVPNRKYRIGRSKSGLGLYAIKPFKKREYFAADVDAKVAPKVSF